MWSGEPKQDVAGALPGRPPREVLDLDAALDRMDGDTALLAEIAALFLQDVDEMLGAVRGAVDAGDATLLGRTAHKLKGSLVTFAAPASAASALRLETLGRQGSTDGAAAELARLERELARLCPVLRELARGESVR